MFFGGGAFPTQNIYTNRNRRFQRQNQEEREVSQITITYARFTKCHSYFFSIHSRDTQLYLI